MKIEEFRKYLKIDKFNLDDELIESPGLVEEIGDAVADALAEMDALKEALANVDADLDNNLRKQCKQNEERATDKAIDKAIQRSPLHRKAFDAYLNAKHQYNKLANLQEAFVKRSFAINKLCELYIAGYFQRTSVQGSSTKDRVVYDMKRDQFAKAREARNK